MSLPLKKMMRTIALFKVNKPGLLRQTNLMEHVIDTEGQVELSSDIIIYGREGDRGGTKDAFHERNRII